MNTVEMKKAVRRPEIKDVDAAIRIYYSKDYIGNKEFLEIFGTMGRDRIARLKNAIREEERRQGQPEVVLKKVCTEIAYEVLNIDIKKLVDKRQRLVRMGMWTGSEGA